MCTAVKAKKSDFLFTTGEKISRRALCAFTVNPSEGVCNYMQLRVITFTAFTVKFYGTPMARAQRMARAHAECAGMTVAGRECTDHSVSDRGQSAV